MTLARTGPVVVHSYADRIDADLARTRLESEGIQAFVVEPAGFNPMLNDSAGGILVQVGSSDAARAREILAQPLLDDEQELADEGASDVVRCPRCELEYCFFERPRPRGVAPGAADLLVMLLSIVLQAAPKRWRCHKCFHVWDDLAESPKRRTPLPEGAPRPIFRLRRSRAGTGLFAGFLAGVMGYFILRDPTGYATALWVSSLPLLAPLVGWLIGRTIQADLCSEASCRAPLADGVMKCERCKGHVAGVIRRAHEHHSESAEFRRELARDAPLVAPPEKKKTKKKRRRALPI